MQNRKAPCSYPESFKRKVIEEYLETGCTKSSLQLKYGIKSTSAIPTWIRLLGYRDNHSLRVHSFSPSNPVIMPDKDQQQGDDSSQLKRRIKELERQLEDAKLRAEAYERIIDKAEKELKIPIRKKPDAR